MTDDIITRKNLINQSATKQPPVLSFAGTCPGHSATDAAVFFTASGGVCARSQSHYRASDARVDASAKRTTSSLDRGFAWSNALSHSLHGASLLPRPAAVEWPPQAVGD